MEIVSREEWGAADPTRIETTEHRELYLHHTVGSGARDKDGDGDLGDDYTKDVQTYHMSKGWDDIAYNFLIDPDGLEVYEGQGWGREPNAQAGHNHGTFAVAVMGDFRKKQPAPELLDKIAELIRYGQELGHLPNVPLQGHRDAPGSEGNECPGGHLYAKLGEINERIEDEMVDRGTKADDGRGFPSFEKAVKLGIMSEHTQPGGVAFNDEIAVFLERAGVFGIGELRKEIAALQQDIAALADQLDNLSVDPGDHDHSVRLVLE